MTTVVHIWTVLAHIGSAGGLLFLAFIAWGLVAADRDEHGPRRWTLKMDRSAVKVVEPEE